MDKSKLVFRTEVTSALFGTFNAGDIATNIDPKIADDLVATGCAVWADGDGKAQADAAAAAAGKITSASQAAPAVQRQEHSFAVGNLAEQQAAGVVSPAGTVAGAMVPPNTPPMVPMQSRAGPVTQAGMAGTAHAGPDASATGAGHAPGQSSDAAAGTAPK